MTPEEATDIGIKLADISAKQAQLGELLVEIRTSGERRDTLLANAMSTLSAELREDAAMRFETLQNMFEQLRTEVLARIEGAEKAIVERLEQHHSDLLNLLQRINDLGGRVDSALEMGVKRAEEITALRAELGRIKEGVAQVYNRMGGLKEPSIDELAATEPGAAAEHAGR